MWRRPPLASFLGFKSLTLTLGFFALAVVGFFGILLTSLSFVRRLAIASAVTYIGNGEPARLWHSFSALSH